MRVFIGILIGFCFYAALTCFMFAEMYRAVYFMGCLASGFISGLFLILTMDD